MNKELLVRKLNKMVDKAKWRIEKKALFLPVRVLLPKILEKSGKSYPMIVSTFWGGRLKVILPEAVSTFLYRFGYFDEEVCRYMIESLDEGSVFIDVGAHFGSFSLFGSYLTGKSGQVIAVDPTPSTYQLMRSNLDRFAPYKNFVTHNIALYDKGGKTTFFDFGLEKSAYNSLIGSRDTDMKDDEGVKIEVTTRTLDDLVREINPPRVDFIKIDAESAELAILKGGTDTIERFSPTITIEIGDTGLKNAPKSIEIISFLKEAGYNPYELRGNVLVPHTIRDNYDKATLSCYNLLFRK